MKFVEIQAHIGQRVWVNSDGDLWMDSGVRPAMCADSVVLLRLTKAGLARVRLDDGTEYSVPQRNIQDVAAPRHGPGVT